LLRLERNFEGKKARGRPTRTRIDGLLQQTEQNKQVPGIMTFEVKELVDGI